MREFLRPLAVTGAAAALIAACSSAPVSGTVHRPADTGGAAETPQPPAKGAAYVRHGEDGTKQIVWDRPDGKPRVETLADGRPLTQVAVSPDGSRAAWILDGELHVTHYFGAGRDVEDRVVASDAGIAPCETPVFSPDSATVAYSVRSDSGEPAVATVAVDGTGGRVVGPSEGICHLAWSGDGRFLAGYAGTTEGVYLLDTTTGAAHRAAGIELAKHVQSLSPDGGRVVVHRIGPEDPGGDGAWPPGFPPTIVDTRTGKKVAIPVGGTLIGAMYLHDGRLAVRVKGSAHNTIVIVGTDGAVERRTGEPVRFKDDSLVTVLG
ncbi:hypothetical protein [Planotetraspora kaengkrachanensis]|uniref:WD40 repeat domain-containing protein n=1 Tax=Planotetraspora kaengkrachanensis TaxID=575193 RepID=A0A8J3PY44_9ACTN|nr:hypothetical protein [Planotetraspora kaengkrachanensis]GIG83281.1 hypothetical protein Pka01_64080 [Planotetraspora kaengkrachanensis]